MQPNTQSQNLKICNSCKRTLHLSCFGITRKSKDGFNACCKECRNYRRRKSYHQSSCGEFLILPLNENNLSVLKKVIVDSIDVELSAINMRSNQDVTFKLKARHNLLEFDYSYNGERYIFSSYVDKESFTEFTIKFLSRHYVRLFLIEHPFLQMEWQSRVTTSPF